MELGAGTSTHLCYPHKRSLLDNTGTSPRETQNSEDNQIYLRETRIAYFLNLIENLENASQKWTAAGQSKVQALLSEIKFERSFETVRLEDVNLRIKMILHSEVGDWLMLEMADSYFDAHIVQEENSIRETPEHKIEPIGVPEIKEFNNLCQTDDSLERYIEDLKFPQAQNPTPDLIKEVSDLAISDSPEDKETILNRYRATPDPVTVDINCESESLDSELVPGDPPDSPKPPILDTSNSQNELTFNSSPKQPKI